MTKKYNHLYCFSEKELQILDHEAPSLFSEIIDLSEVDFSNYYNEYINGQLDLESEALWRFEQYHHFNDDNFLFCYKFFNYDPAKLLIFNLAYDSAKIYKFNNKKSLKTLETLNAKLEDLSDAEYKFKNYCEEIESSIYGMKILENEFNDIYKSIENFHEKTKINIHEKFNKTFCK